MYGKKNTWHEGVKELAGGKLFLALMGIFHDTGKIW